ncbi:ABC transporter permease [Streptomyces europaeiscabiei]|uniref:ABC transporter permease n=1 Tax=Streptomyces europaeiscabiei TaxID=146819 RepID=UPI0029B1EE2F|nr:ABC transporter permease [Streptomyces europaeiscabiei]MDX2525294.1 ABC transporter permease [Streptomyces europaeiscabiei]
MKLLVAHPAITVLERHLLLYRRLWRASVFSLFVVPALFLLSMGFGVGSFVPRIDNTDYSMWIVPGLLALLAFQTAINESTMGIYTDFEWIGAFHVMRHTRVRIFDMIVGWLLYVLVVVEFATAAFMVVTWAFGVPQPALAVLCAPFVCALLAVSVAAPTTAFAATVRDEGHFHLLTQFGVMPAIMVSGVFFPAEQLPALLRPLAWISPLWHATEVNRAAALDTLTVWPLTVHIGVLLAWAVVGFVWARVAFHRRLAH